MGLDQKVGNRRNFLLTNHRLNKDALLQILDDMMHTVNNSNAATLGSGDPNFSFAEAGVSAAGTDGRWDYTVDNISSLCVITFTRPGYLIYGAKDDDGYACSKVVLFDPSNPAQTTSSIILDGYVAQDCYLWFRRMEANADSDSEARWSVGTGEVFTSTFTRKREWVEFAVTTIAPNATYNEENGYFRFAVIDSWSGLVPDIRFIHFADRRGLEHSSNNPNAKNFNTVVNGGFGMTAGPLGSQSLTGLVKDLVNQMYMLQDSDWDITLPRGYVNAVGQNGWFHRPDFGMKQIGELLPRARSAVLSQGVVTYDAGSNTYAMTYSRNADDNVTVSVLSTTQVTWATSPSASGAGYKCTMTVSNVPTNWYVTGVLVSSHLPGYSFPGSRLNTLWVASPSTPFPFFGDGTTDFNIDVMPYSTVPSGSAELVYAAAGSFSFQIIGYWE